ncbi:sulfatase-like hydrolase/transferase [bacterium]|nr:sulfatase-like hydrolase/transferase [bacterium]
MIVLVVVADSLRADDPGYAGGADTPALDALAEGGATFDAMYAAGAWTVPAFMSLLSAGLPHRVGVCRWRHPFPPNRPTLFTAFADAGFEVAAFHPHPRWGFLTVPGKGVVGDSQEPRQVIERLRGRRGRDLIVVVHHWWTHLPYVTRKMPRRLWHAACDYALESLNRHPERVAQTLARTHRKSVTHFSEEILPRYIDAATSGGEAALIVVTGDHGETWGASLPKGRRVENIYDLHGRWIADETVRVPLVVHGRAADGFVPTTRVSGFASGVDFTPTICDLAGVPWPASAPHADTDVAGVSLANCVMHGAPSPRDEIVVVSSHNTHEPNTYPENGRAMWRTFGLRRADAWFVYDGVACERVIAPVGDAPAAVESDAVFARLARMHAASVDSAPIVDHASADDLRTGRGDPVRALRSLGYLE